MKRHLGLAVAAVGCLALVACGGAAADTSAAAGSASQSSSAAGTGTGTGRGAGRNGTAGEVVQVSGSNLVLNTQTGDVTVKVTGTTVYTRTRTGTLADIAVGLCLTARGQKDGAGNLNVQTVAISPAVNGACTGPGGFGGGPGGGAPGGGAPGGGAPGSGTQSGSSTSTGTGPNPNFTGVRGLTTAVNGTTVTVKAADGTQSTVTIPTTVTVTSSAAASQSDLSIGDCVLANGQKDAAGLVTARSVSIVPAGPTGCFTGGAGFGGGGRGGGAGGRATPAPAG